MPVQISDSELEIMKIIWASNNTALYAMIMEKLAENGNSWQKNTVITLLSRLVEKGLLKTSKIGRRNKYTAVVSETDYQVSQARNLLNKLFEGSAKGLVSTLIETEILTQSDYNEIISFWKGYQDE